MDKAAFPNVRSVANLVGYGFGLLNHSDEIVQVSHLFPFYRLRSQSQAERRPSPSAPYVVVELKDLSL